MGTDRSELGRQFILAPVKWVSPGIKHLIVNNGDDTSSECIIFMLGL